MINRTYMKKAINRKDFLTRACISGACLCGFSALAMAKENSGAQNTTLGNDNATLLMQDWINSLLSDLNVGLDKEELRKMIRKSAVIHYNNLKMDEMLAQYEKKPEAFKLFIEEKWGWKVDYNPAARIIKANENKSYCVCPLVNKEKGASPALCYCSEGFAEKMFSKVMGIPVTAEVISSIQRGDQCCVYQIKW
jgi:hypothetical protein